MTVVKSITPQSISCQYKGDLSMRCNQFLFSLLFIQVLLLYSFEIVMKKKISRDKVKKNSVEKKLVRKELKKMSKFSPLFTLDCLLKKTQCLQEARQFEKVRIQRIVQGGTSQSIRFHESQKSLCLQQHIRKYYPFSDVRSIFTELITRNSLINDITFVDFKLRHFKIMNNYQYLKKQLPKGKGKEEINNTASHSFTAENQQKIELGVHKIIKNKQQKSSQNVSTSFIHMLTKNIQKMIKNIKDESPLNKDIDFKPVLHHQETMNTPDISNIYNERIHTTPEPMACDFYGLGQYWNGSQIRPKGDHKHHKKVVERQPTITTHRFQTEYDTEYITAEKKKPKSKCTLTTSRSKKSFSKKKVLSKGKSPPSGLKCSLKMKK